MKDKIRMQFLGATGYVTGSRILVETDHTRLYVDAGLYQGPSYVEERNFIPLETDPSRIHAIFLTHAHIDHTGLLPLLVKKGFRGEIFATPGTRDLLQILLPDAGRIQEEEYKFYSKKKIRDYELTGPLFTEEDALNTLSLIQAVPFNTPFPYRDFTATYYWAGHILGAAQLRLEALNRSIHFSGDLGPREPILHRPRENPLPADYVVVESTYGNRMHEEEDYTKKLEMAVQTILRRKSMLIIPSFAVGRTQLILYVLFKMMKDKIIPEVPVFIDSPMATRATQTYLAYPSEMLASIIKEGFFDYLQSRRIQMIEDVVDSKRLNYFSGPGIIVSASGMANGGRILHHLYNRLWDRRNVLLFIGYQAEGTLGRLILEGASRVKIFNREVPVRLEVDKINSFSAHADQEGLLEFIRLFQENEPKTLFINHGEDEARETLASKVLFFKNTRIEIPRFESTYYL